MVFLLPKAGAEAVDALSVAKFAGIERQIPPYSCARRSAVASQASAFRELI